MLLNINYNDYCIHCNGLPADCYFPKIGFNLCYDCWATIPYGWVVNKLDSRHLWHKSEDKNV